ncbi:ATP-binding protein [Thiosulfatihalobacter marinus]|uniref:ATP-binding protein n=1 Tax=Thiosulfatihalobacter marinus TaxID=2792481 RepID=UPI0018D9710D|nr:ATP-binding protein [Thiosulfatihalobacter marinus]
MIFKWLKRYMPRGLYGRAALILIFPVVFLQLVVSVVFIQRQFEGVTTQMTRAVAREVRLVLDRAVEKDSDPDGLAEVLASLQMRIAFPDEITGEDTRRWYDFSALIVNRNLRGLIPEIQVVQLAENKVVRLKMKSEAGPVQIEFDRARVSATNSHQLLVNMVFFGALLTLVAYLYLRNQLKPITRLAAAAEAFGRGRHVPYSPGGAVEVRAAGNAFVDMRARIERQIEQRTLMLSGVSHDLRTPLTRLRLGLSLLETDDREPLLRDVEEMQRMLDAFLSFARGAHEGEPETVRPKDLVERVVADCARGGLNVVLHACEGGGVVKWRVSAMRRALENLIENAVRYGGMAEVSLRITEKSIRVRVEDCGPGIAPQDREEALKPFARLDEARNQNKGLGVGLGLSIAADVARAHGGVLRLDESTRLGGLCADMVFAR